MKCDAPVDVFEGRINATFSAWKDRPPLYLSACGLSVCEWVGGLSLSVHHSISVQLYVLCSLCVWCVAGGVPPADRSHAQYNMYACMCYLLTHR